MTRLRMRVAERLKGAQNTYAMLTTFNEVDMTSLIEMRNSYKVRVVHKGPRRVHGEVGATMLGLHVTRSVVCTVGCTATVTVGWCLLFCRMPS